MRRLHTLAPLHEPTAHIPPSLQARAATKVRDASDHAASDMDGGAPCGEVWYFRGRVKLVKTGTDDHTGAIACDVEATPFRIGIHPAGTSTEDERELPSGTCIFRGAKCTLQEGGLHALLSECAAIPRRQRFLKTVADVPESVVQTFCEQHSDDPLPEGYSFDPAVGYYDITTGVRQPHHPSVGKFVERYFEEENERRRAHNVRVARAHEDAEIAKKRDAHSKESLPVLGL